MPPREALCRVFSKQQGSGSRGDPCLLWRTLSTSWFRVKGWGWGIVSVFITSGNIQSDNHHARRSKAKGGVIYRWLCCDSKHVSGGLTPRCAGVGKSSPVTAVWVWTQVGLHSEATVSESLSPLWGRLTMPHSKAKCALELVFN